MAASGQACLTIQDLTKIYGGTIALHDANLEFMTGEVHALAGENGAGKSTMCKMLSGAISPDRGTIQIDGESYTKFTPKEAKLHGIGMIYQEFNLVPELPIYENLFLGKELRRGPNVDRSAMIRRTIELFDSMEIRIDPQKRISEISVAYCQLVEIGKALLENKKILIMDEPTAPLTNQEVAVLFKLIGRLRDQGITIIYISHRMEEIFALSDRITVMRDGAVIKTMNTGDTDVAEIIRLMIGREGTQEYPPLPEPVADRGAPALRVRGLCNRLLKDVSFDLHRGEILGIAGLVGAGRTETVRAVFGADQLQSGTVEVNGRPVKIRSPRDAIDLGIGLIPEDRKRQGVHLDLSIRHNMSLIKAKELSRLLTMSPSREKKLMDEYIHSLSIKLATVENPVSSLSGGNQQKVVLAKWLATQADILIFDEPTRGIDVGAKSEIYELLDKLRRQGKAIIMISSEMYEILGMCDRILVMYEGRITGEVSGHEATQTRVMELASGIEETTSEGEGA